MSQDLSSIFNKIKTGMSKNSPSNSTTSKNILKLEVDNVYLGRLVYNKNDVENSIYHYYHHGWKNPSTGKYLTLLCPSTVNKYCPVCKKSIELYRSGDPSLIEASKTIARRENWLVNFYIISDSKNPDNDGLIKILRYGKQLNDIIEAAFRGKKSSRFGDRIWRLDSEGCDFRIEVSPNSNRRNSWPMYHASEFLLPSESEGNSLSDEKIEEVLSKVFDLSKFLEEKPTDYLLSEMEKHLSGSNMGKSLPELVNKESISDDEELTKIVVNKKDIQKTTDDEIDELLKEI